MSWVDNSTSEDGFNIERRLGSGTTFTQIATVGANVTSYTDSGLLDATTYCYRVQAFNAAGVSAYSNEQCVTTAAATTSYTLTVAKNGTGVGVVTATGINCGSICSASFTSGTSVTLTALAASGSTFAGWSGTGCGTGTVTVNGNMTCTATFNTNVTIDPSVPAQLTLSWTDNSTNEDGFNIERRLGSGTTFTRIATVGANVTSYTDGGLLDATTYCYRVQAFNAAGVSAYSNEQCVTTAAVAVGSLQFSLSGYSVNENGGTAAITITRSGGSAGAVSVTFSTSNGTASAGSDYTAVSQAVSFADGDTASKTVNIPIINDSSYEGNETVNLTLSSPTGGASLGSPSTAVLTIVDDDPAAVLAVTGLTGDKASPQKVGTTIVFTAATSGGIAPVQYKWWLLSGGVWSVVKDWSTSNSYSWTPGAAGNYRIGVWARNSGKNNDAPENNNSFMGVDFKVTAAAVLAVTGLTGDKASPQKVGTTIIFTAATSGGIAPVQYKWWLFNGTTWSVVKDWSTSNSYSWTPGVAGNYRIGVWARNNGNSNDAPENNNAFNWLDFTISTTVSEKIGIYRPSTGQWLLDLNGNGTWDGCSVDFCVQSFTSPDGIPVVGEWSASDVTELGLFLSDTTQWQLDGNSNESWDGCGVDICLGPFGQGADIPLSGKWSSTGYDRIGTFRPGTGEWFLDLNGNGKWNGCNTDRCANLIIYQLGDLPVTGDWSGSGVTRVGLFRPSTGEWFLDSSGNRSWDGCRRDRCVTAFGTVADLPVSGDWDGTGASKIGVFRPSTGEWFLDLNGNGKWDGCGIDLCVSQFGQAGDIPVIGKW